MRFFGLDVEKLQTSRGSCAGQVCVVERVNGRRVVHIDTYIKVEGDVKNYCTLYSGLTESKIARGRPLALVRKQIFALVRGNTVVTLAGADDFRSLGISPKSKIFINIELQDTLRRRNGQPMGLGPLCYYFGVDVLINHNCVEDAWATLLIYLDHLDPKTRLPYIGLDEEKVLTTREYRKIMNLAGAPAR